MDERFTPEVVDDILSGRPVTPPLAAEVGAVLSGLHNLRQEPAADLAARHIAAMTAAAAAIGPQPAPITRRARRHARRMTPRWAAVSSLVAALSLTTGLAAAGALPGPAQHAASSLAADVGIHLPTGDHTPASDVPSVARDNSTTGCEHGEAVSDAAKAQHADESSSTSTSSTQPEPERTCTTAGKGSGSNSGPSTNQGRSDTTGRDNGHKGSSHTSTTSVHNGDANHPENEPAETESTEPSGRDVHRGGGNTETTQSTTQTTTHTTSQSTTTTSGSGGGGGGGGGGGNKP
jgi:hypothetical protein